MIFHDERGVQTKVAYLARDEIYKTEKAYGTDFLVTDLGYQQATNHRLEHHAVWVKDVRNLRDSERPDLDKHGFQFIQASTALSAEAAFGDPKLCAPAYFSELENIVMKTFPQYKYVKCFDFAVRKRDVRFPTAIKTIVSHEQPAALPHADYSQRGAHLQMQISFPGQDDNIGEDEFDLLNLWRPLVGPNDDWPLALCDAQSLDEGDLCDNDAVHEDCVGENTLLHANDRHRWYYMSKQGTDDLLIFRNVNSRDQRARGFHAAFENPRSTSAPRQSVEVRMVAFY